MDKQPASLLTKDAEISISRVGDIQFWCDRLGCTAAELGNAIGQVGYSVERVRALLQAEGRTVQDPQPPPVNSKGERGS